MKFFVLFFSLIGPNGCDCIISTVASTLLFSLFFLQRRCCSVRRTRLWLHRRQRGDSRADWGWCVHWHRSWVSSHTEEGQHLNASQLPPALIPLKDRRRKMRRTSKMTKREPASLPPILHLFILALQLCVVVLIQYVIVPFIQYNGWSHVGLNLLIWFLSFFVNIWNIKNPIKYLVFKKREEEDKMVKYIFIWNVY